MTDPYSVLEIKNGAEMEEVTAAYRKLAKKYHPDLNPGDKTAELKMRQVNAAYEQIKAEKSGKTGYESGYGSQGYGSQSYGSDGRSYRGENPFGGFDNFDDIWGNIFGNRRQEIIMNLRNHRYREAETLLSREKNKDAQWYYLSAHVNAGLGNRVSALNHASEAVRLDPDNWEYRQLLAQLERGGSAYRQTGRSRGFPMRNFGRSLLNIILLQLACCFCCRCC